MTVPGTQTPAVDGGTALDLPGLFARTVANHPDQVAVKSAGRALTYCQLDRRTGQLARALSEKLGPTPSPVAILIAEPLDVVVALMGVLRSGHFYSILSPKQPAARLTAIIEDLQTPLILSDSALKPLAEQSAVQGCAVFTLDQAGAVDDSPFALAVPPENYAGVYYTSGSTGEPKGVLRKHAALIQRGQMEIKLHSLTANDKLILTHALSATASLLTVFSAFFSGATIILYEADKQGIAPLAELLVTEKITIFRLTVELMRYFLDGLAPDAFFPDVRVVMSAGDVFYRRDVERLWMHVPEQAVFIHHLAASESSILTRNIIRRDTPLDGDVVPVGKPLPGRDILLLDENGQRVPPGESGEICVRSELEFPGYWRRPELTESKFIPDPDNAGRRIYASGDLGRFRPDGQLEFIGRKDARVKIRGFSVDLSAIESVLMSMPDVRRAVVVARDEGNGQKRLAAYVVPIPNVAVTQKALRDHVAGRLPVYMIPAAFTLLLELPLTTTGKVDRKALPVPDWGQFLKRGEMAAPADETEERLAQLWKKVLRLERLSVRDNFFELGGDSLMAGRLMAEIERQFGVRLPLSILVEFGTVVQLARAVREPDKFSVRALLPIQPQGGKLPLYLIPGAFGDAMVWRRIIPYMDHDRPLYGVQALRHDGDSLYKLRVEDAAAHFLRDIRGFQPRGPYHLAGYSFGGALAFEMARQLEQAGEAVAFLGIVDASPPGDRPQATFVERIRIHAGNLADMTWKERGDYINDGVRRFLLRRARKDAVRRAMPVDKLIGTDHMAATGMALHAYRPDSIYGGPAVIFKVTESAWYVTWDRMAGWRRWIPGDLRIAPVPGNHGSVMREPHVKELALKMREFLER